MGLEVILWTAWVLVVVCLLEIVSKADILVLCSLNLKELKLLHKNSMLPAKKWKSLPTRFTNEIIPVKGFDKKKNEEVLHDTDEGIRWPTDPAKLKKLPLLKPEGGRITAATASQICDGASAMLVCNEAGLKKLGLRPRAKIVALALAGDDPVMMLGGPIPATQNELKRAGLSINDMDLYEVNEAFASVPLAWQKALGADLNKLNVNGGAMALGHPLGATGTKIMTTLLNKMERRDLRYGLQAICEGGGTANATIIERIPQSKL